MTSLSEDKMFNHVVIRNKHFQNNEGKYFREDNIEMEKRSKDSCIFKYITNGISEKRSEDQCIFKHTHKDISKKDHIFEICEANPCFLNNHLYFTNKISDKLSYFRDNEGEYGHRLYRRFENLVIENLVIDD